MKTFLLRILFLTLMGCPLLASQSYTIQDLGSLSATPADEVIAKGINNRGHVMGQNKKTNISGTGWQMRSFLWDGHQKNEIFPSATGSTWAGSLNDSDLCVGQDTVSAARTLGFIWSQGVIQSDIDLGPHHWTFQKAINAHNNQGGTFYSDETWGLVFQYHAYVRAASGSWLDLGSLADNRSFFNAMNDFEVVVGNTGGLSGGKIGFRWNLAGGMVDIGNLGGAHCDPYTVNNLGQIGGHSTNSAGDWRPFLLENSIMTDLGTLGGKQGLVWGLNDLGQAVGASDDVNQLQRATLWAGGNIFDLNALIPSGSGWNLTGAKSINELGEICGTGWINGLQRSYKLTPVLVRPRISGFQPGIAGENNHIFGFGFSPNTAIQIYYGFSPGNTPLPCGAVLAIHQARSLVATTSDADGRIEIPLALPQRAAGKQPLLQAVEISGCVLSELFSQTIF